MTVTNLVAILDKKIVTLSRYTTEKQTRYCCTEQFLPVASIVVNWITLEDYEKRRDEIKETVANYTQQIFKVEE